MLLVLHSENEFHMERESYGPIVIDNLLYRAQRGVRGRWEFSGKSKLHSSQLSPPHSHPLIEKNSFLLLLPGRCQWQDLRKGFVEMG